MCVCFSGPCICRYAINAFYIFYALCIICHFGYVRVKPFDLIFFSMSTFAIIPSIAVAHCHNASFCALLDIRCVCVCFFARCAWFQSQKCTLYSFKPNLCRLCGDVCLYPAPHIVIVDCFRTLRETHNRITCPAIESSQLDGKRQQQKTYSLLMRSVLIYNNKYFEWIECEWQSSAEIQKSISSFFLNFVAMQNVSLQSNQNMVQKKDKKQSGSKNCTIELLYVADNLCKIVKRIKVCKKRHTRFFALPYYPFLSSVNTWTSTFCDDKKNRKNQEQKKFVQKFCYGKH